MSVKRDKSGGYVAGVGRWRVRVKFGRYRFGLHRTDGWSAFSWGAGIATGNVLRRG